MDKETAELVQNATRRSGFAKGDIDVSRLYTEVMVPCWPNLISQRLLEMMLSGKETADAYARILRLDPELLDQIFAYIRELGLEKKVKEAAHAVGVLGIEHVRDMILGRGIYFRFYHQEFLEDRARLEAVVRERAARGLKDDTQIPEEPKLQDFISYVERGNLAEALMRRLRVPYPELAFAGGILFDIFKGQVDTMDLPPGVHRDEVLNCFDDVWTRGMKSGLAALAISDELNLAHKKYAFISGLLHNIGKLVLLVYAPKEFLRIQEYIREEKIPTSVIEETRLFSIDHAQAGALYMGQLHFLSDIELAVDFHHDNSIVKFFNIPLYHFAGLIAVAGFIVRQVKNKDTLVIDPKNDFFKREEFLCLGFNMAQFVRIQKRYLKLIGYLDKSE